MFSKNEFDKIDDIVCTTVSYNYKELTLNWIENLKKFNLEKNIVVFCLDKNIFNTLKNIVNAKEVNIKDKITDRSSWIEIEKKYKVTGPLELFKKFKKNILFSDVDVIFLDDPLKRFKRYNSDIIVTNDKRYSAFNLARKQNHIITIQNNVPVDWGITDQQKFGYLNGAVGYYRYSEKTEKLFDLAFAKKNIDFYPKGIEDGAAQTIFNDAIKEFDISVTVVSVFDVANGSLLDVPYLKKKVMETAYGIHYNYCDSDPYKGYQEKMQKIKNDNFWFL